MAISCPVDLDTNVLRSEVSGMYSRVAANPDGDFHFHRGPAYAADLLGYDRAELAALPAESTASFARIANPHAIAPILPGETVLDIGCGAGTDLLLAARRVGPGGRAIGIDMTEAMRDRACASAAAAGLTNVEVYLADGTAIPLQDAASMLSSRTACSDLISEKEKAFQEIHRVLRLGGRLPPSDKAPESTLQNQKPVLLFAGIPQK